MKTKKKWIEKKQRANTEKIVTSFNYGIVLKISFMKMGLIFNKLPYLEAEITLELSNNYITTIIFCCYVT